MFTQEILNDTPLDQLVPPAQTSEPVRCRFAGYTSDPASAELLRTALAAVIPDAGQVQHLGFAAMIERLGKTQTPAVLLVDLSNEDQPLTALMALAPLVEPETVVLVIGESRDLSFYRSVVHGLGVSEYLAKPLTVEKIHAHLLPFITASHEAQASDLGRLIAITGVRGGVGASTVAANLAWVIGHEQRRHTVLLDTDLHRGTAALSCNLGTARGLAAALERPERLDKMFIERTVQPAAGRLHLLAAQEGLDVDINYSPGSGKLLVGALRERYKFVIADTGTRQMPFAQDLVYEAHRRVFVLDPTMISIRNFQRMHDLAGRPARLAEPVLVLNQAGRAGAISQAAMEQALGRTIDLAIPEQRRIVVKAERYGEMAAAIRGAFRNGILRLAEILGANAISTVNGTRH